MDEFRISVKAFIVSDGKLLTLKRRSDEVHYAGKWDIPGGRLESGEDPFEGVKRETREETGLEIEVLTPLEINHFVRDDGQRITMIAFLCKPLTKEVRISETAHTEYKWVEVKNTELLQDWLVPIAKHLFEYGLDRFVGSNGPAEQNAVSGNIKLFVATKAFILYEGKVLIIQESSKYKDGSNIGKFDVVGGRITPGEHFEESLRREVMEETGLKIRLGKPFFVNESRPVVRGENWQVIRMYFETFAENDKIVLGEDHENYLWIDPKDYKKYNIIENMYPAFETYIENGRNRGSRMVTC